LNASIYIFFYLLITEAQYAVAAGLQIRILACIAATLLWCAMPVCSIAFNDQHRFRKRKIAQKLLAYNILKLISDRSGIKRLHHLALYTRRASRLEGYVACQGMLYSLLRVGVLPFTNSLSPFRATLLIISPLEADRLRGRARFYSQFIHNALQYTLITTQSDINGYVRHLAALLKAFFDNALQRFANLNFRLSYRISYALSVSASMRTGRISLASNKWRAANAAVSVYIVHKCIIPYSTNCVRAFAPHFE
jgi:hypothetical protein